MSEKTNEGINEAEVIECSICDGNVDHHSTKEGKVYWTLGHNAEPINKGRCCDNCNETFVIPSRLVGLGHPQKYADAIGEMMSSQSYKDGVKNYKEAMGNE